MELAAHEAAHTVQQASGKVQLRGGVGIVGDKYEQNADAVAASLASESAAPLLADFSGEQKTNQNGERQPQGQSSTDTHSTESHRSQTRADHLNEAQRLFDLGVLQAQIGNYQGALQFYEEALKLAPNNSLIWYNRGVVLSQLNRLQEALDAYQTALAMNSNWGEEGQPYFAWSNRGTILRRLGRFNEAIQSYQQALALNPGNEVIQNNLRNLEAYLSANPSLSNQSQQTPEPEQGNNLLQTLLGGLQGAFNENQTGDEAIADFLIGLIPIIGQLADARDFAAYFYKIVFKRQFNDAWNWIGLALTLVGLVPIVGDIAKFLGKTVVRGGLSALGSNLEDVLKLIRSINPGFVDDIAQLKGLLAQNWGKGVQAALDRWNTALGQLLNWVNGIPDILFSQQKRQLIEAVQEVKSQSDKMLSRAFDEIRRKIDDALDEIGRLLNPNGQRVTPEGVRLPNPDGTRSEPLRIEGGEGTRSTSNSQARNIGSEAEVSGSRQQQPTETVPRQVAARQWAAQELQIPAEILNDLSVEAIERLKRLPRWARDRFSQLNHAAMRRILECSSPCKVDLQEVLSYLRNLAADAVAGARRLTTPEEVINALPTDLLNLDKLREKLAKPELMNIIMRAELTELDFAKMRDFITKNLTGDKKQSYDVFTQYLSAVVPSKLGPDLNKFIEFAEPMDDATGRALRRAMFENFTKLHVPEFQGLERATFNVPGYKDIVVNTDLFDPTNGTIWEFKYQKTKLASKELNKYVPIIGQRATDTLYEAKTANFVFPTEDLARLNYANLKDRPAHKVFFLQQPSGQAIRPVELQ